MLVLYLVSCLIGECCIADGAGDEKKEKPDDADIKGYVYPNRFFMKHSTPLGCAAFGLGRFLLIDRNNGRTRQLLVFYRAEEAKKGADGDVESSKDKEAEKAADQPQDVAVAKEEKADS